MENQNKLLKPKKTDLAYIAGLFDGEGCICIAKRKSKSHKVGYAIGLRVDLCNADPRAPLFLSKYFGGAVYRKKKKGKRSYSFRWRQYNLSSIKFLEKISPYLKLKKEELQVAREFRATFDSNKYGSGNEIPLKLIEKRDRIRLKMKGLKWNRNDRRN